MSNLDDHEQRLVDTDFISLLRERRARDPLQGKRYRIDLAQNIIDRCFDVARVVNLSEIQTYAMIAFHLANTLTNMSDNYEKTIALTGPPPFVMEKPK